MTRSPVRVRIALALMAALAATGAAYGQPAVPLGTVLDNMARVGNTFRTMEARVERDTVNGLVDDHDLTAGTVYFAAEGDDSRIRLSITEPAASRQDVLVAEGSFQSYNPRTNQVTVGTLGGRSDIAQFLVVGFGPANSALESNFEIGLVGEETIDGKTTSVVELVPRSSQVLRSVSRIRLWVDRDRWIPIQQRLDQPSLNYQMVRYSSIKVNAGISDSIFELDLPSNVDTLRVN